MSFGGAIKSARARKGWTQRQLSEATGITAPMICRVERGKKTDLRISTLRRLCEALGVTSDSLLWPRPGA